MEDIGAEKDNEDGEIEKEDNSQIDNISNHEEDSQDHSDQLEDESTQQESNKENETTPTEEEKDRIQASESDVLSKQEVKHNKEDNVNGKKKLREGKPFTKVVIRRLPPSMTKEIFLDQVSPLPSYDYFYFVSASTTSPGGFSRAYINFINQNDLFDFTRTFDNYVFIDSRGHEYAAIVEFAPYQRVPKARTGRKKDTLTGTLESDPVYVTFKEQLQAEALENLRTTNKQHYFETEISENEEIVTTPLLEYLKQRRAEKDRIREERREDRKRKDAERKLLKNKVKDKSTSSSLTVGNSTSVTSNSLLNTSTSVNPSSQEDIEIKTNEDLSQSYKTDDESYYSYEDDDTTQTDRTEDLFDPQPIVKAILIKPKSNDYLDCKESENSDFLELGSINKSDSPEDKTKYHRGRTYQNDCYEPNDVQKFSKYKYWERQVRNCDNSGYRYYNRYDSSPREYECYSSWSSSYSFYESVVLQAPKEKKDLNKEKDVKRERTKHRDKEERFIKPENRTREFKNKGGKSYREERLKQAEKREEKKKKENEESTKDSNKDDQSLSALSPTERIAVEEEDKYWNDKKKWKYGTSVDNKGARTFTRRREEKKKEVFDRKRNNNNNKPFGRSRKVSGESLGDDNFKKTDIEVHDKEEKDQNKKYKDDTTILKKENKPAAILNTQSNKTEKNNEVKEESCKATSESKTNEKKDRLQKESSVDSEEGNKAKDPRVERRIRNKDRPSIEIYRPGMGKFSRQRLEKEKTLGSTDESPSHSPSPQPNNYK